MVTFTNVITSAKMWIKGGVLVIIMNRINECLLLVGAGGGWVQEEAPMLTPFL